MTTPSAHTEKDLPSLVLEIDEFAPLDPRHDNAPVTSAPRRWLIGGVCAAVIAVAGVSVAVAAASPAPSDPSGSQSVTEVTTKTGVLTIEETGPAGTPIAGAVIQVERIAESSYSSSPSTTSSTTDATSTTAPSTTANRDDETALSLPIGVKFDIVTTESPIILAVPEGNYALTHLGVTGAAAGSSTSPAPQGDTPASATTTAPTPAPQTVVVGDHQRTRATLTPAPAPSQTVPTSN